MTITSSTLNSKKANNSFSPPSLKGRGRIFYLFGVCMSIRFRITFIVLFLLTLYILLIDQKIPGTDEQILHKHSVLAFKEDSLSLIRFRERAMELIRVDKESYRLSKPVSHPARRENVSNLFTVFSNITAINTLPDPEEDGKTPAFYGLDKPRAIVELEAPDQKEILEIGNKTSNPDLPECYARIQGKKGVHVINEQLARLVLEPVSYYMDSVPFKDIEKSDALIEWHYHGQSCFLKRIRGQYYTKGSEELEWQAIYQKAEPFFQVIQQFSLSLLPYETLSDSECGMENFQNFVTVECPGFKKTLWIGKEEGGKQYLKLEKQGLAFKGDSRLMKLFSLGFKELSAMNVFDGLVTELKGIDLYFHETQHHWKFRGEKIEWTMDHPYGWLFDSGKILSHFLKLMISPVSNLQNRSLEKPFLSIHLNTDPDQGSTPEILQFFKTPDASLFLKRNNLPASAALNSEFLEILEEDPFRFLNSHPFRLILNKSYKIEWSIKDRQGIFKRIEFGKWTSENRSSPVTEEMFLKAIENIECYSSLLAKQGVDFGFKTPLATLTFFDLDNRPLFTAKIGSSSNEKELFILGDDYFFLFCKNTDWLKLL